MSRITSTEQLFRHVSRARDLAILVTGGGAGPARYAAWAFAKHGANVVIGDIFEPGAQNLVDAINRLPPGSGKACWKRCDVARWDDQVALFELAMTKFGGVDIVIAGARVGELQNFGMPQVGADGKPIKPHLKTLNVNLVGAIYTTQLALHYIPRTWTPCTEPLRYIVYLGFTAPWTTNLNREIFATSQHGLFAFLKSTQPALTLNGIRTAMVQSISLPGNGDSGSLLEKIASAMVFCATNPDRDANGSVWALLPNGTLQRMEEVEEAGNNGKPPEYTAR